MANDKQPQLDIEQARDLLSPYLDDEVNAQERTLVEQAVASSAELRHELETLRQTVSLVSSLPPMPAPRPFTLSEADVRRPAPARSGLFSLPAWVRGWAMVAATLLCVLTIGGLFLFQQFGTLGSTAPVGELAREPGQAEFRAEEAQEAAPAQAPAEADLADEEMVEEAQVEKEAPPAEEEAPVEMAAEEAEPAPEQEAAPAEEIVEEEAAESTLSEEEVGGAGAEAAEPVTEAGNAAADEVEAQDGGQTTETALAGGQDSAAGAAAATPTVTLPAPTPSPAPTAAAQAIVPAEAEEEKAAEEAAPGPDTAAPQPEAPSSDLDQAEAAGEAGPDSSDDSAAPRLVEIQDQRLRVAPGLIRVEGIIDAAPDTRLLATLRRDGQPFDDWAEPDTRQTTVRPNGQFSLAIEGRAGRADQDLLAAEPAGYQLTITSVGVDEPVTASVFFDTFGDEPVPTEPPPATFTPLPTATAIAQATISPPAAPSVVPSPGARPLDEESASSAGPIRLIIIALILLGALIFVGLVLVWSINRRRR